MSASPQPEKTSPPLAEQSAPPSPAAERMSIWKEFAIFLLENKAYWLAPIIIVMMLLALLVIAGSTPAAPFIYTLF